MSNEILYGITGLLGGTMVGNLSSQQNIECISTPLYGESVVPHLPIEEEYERNLSFNAIPSITTYFFLGIVKGSDFNYYYITYRYIFSSMKCKFYINKMNGKVQESVPIAGYDENATIIKTNGSILVSSPSSTYIMDYINHITKLFINIPAQNFSLELQQTGNPYWYCDGKIAVIKPNEEYLWGFELLGLLNGQFTKGLTTITFSGFGDTEHGSWTTTVGNRLIKEQWIMVSTFNKRVQGVVWDQSVGYKEAGFWIYNIYYKPITYEINNIEYINGKVGDVNVIVYFSNFLMQIKMINMGYSGQENIYGIEVYINGNLIDTGFANYEMKPDLIPFVIY